MQTTAELQIDTTLSPVILLDMIKAGANRIISSESLLNKLNVFPVSDRDTGSNMATLMRFILSQSYSTTEISSLLRQLADASLIGACGNSGMIFSAFFVGLASNENVSNKDFFTIEEFIDCLDLGVKQAHQAVSNPTKGTILTVMSEWLEEFVNAFKHSKDFPTIFKKSVAVAEKALKNTQYQLAVLKRNQVVDAGAYGFVKFIQGMCEYLFNHHGKSDVVAVEETVPAVEMHAHQTEEKPALRYCMETCISNTETDVEAVRNTLSPISDSLVINRSPSLLKIHAHTNDILQVTDYLKNIGTILHQKIDDMEKQWEIAHTRKHRIALVTDSSADIPETWMAQEQIHVLPIQVRFGDHTFLDRLSIDYKSLNKYVSKHNLPAKTSTPSPELIERYLRYLATHYDSIIVIALASRLSGTYQMIANQAENIKTVPITVIDSHKLASGHGFLVMKTACWIAQGLHHNAIVQKIRANMDNIYTYMAVANFKTIIKSGRIPKAIQLFVQSSFLKPILTLNQKGKVSLAGLAFGQKMSWRIMAKIIKKVIKKTGARSIGIAHTSTEEEAKAFAAYLEKQTGARIDFVLDASCSVGLHIGPGCFTVATSLV